MCYATEAAALPISSQNIFTPHVCCWAHETLRTNGKFFLLERNLTLKLAFISVMVELKDNAAKAYLLQI